MAINNTGGQTQEAENILDSVQENANNLLDQAQKAISEANLPEKAQNLWDTVKSWFQ